MDMISVHLLIKGEIWKNGHDSNLNYKYGHTQFFISNNGHDEGELTLF